MKYSLTIKFYLIIIGVVIVILAFALYLYFQSLQKQFDEDSEILALPLTSQYQLGERQNFDFSIFETATELGVSHQADSSSFDTMIIKDIKKVGVAKQYIQTHSDNWAPMLGRQSKMPFTSCAIKLSFYSQDDYIDSYTIAGDRALVYGNLTSGYWKLVDNEELRDLASILDIPEDYLYIYKDSECFPNG